MKSARARTRFGTRGKPPCAMTMVELLIVVAVMVILMGIALPVMKTGIEDRRLREATRQVNVCVELAKSLAVETGLPSAMLIEPEFLPGATEPFATKLYLAESPLPYAGDVVDAKAQVTGSSVSFDVDSGGLLTLSVAAGDFIRFDYKGPYYHIDMISSPPPIFTISGSPAIPNGEYTYQIFRQPQKTGAAPLELPKGTVIDLAVSGLGEDNQFENVSNVRPLSLVFGPGGRLVRVRYERPSPLLPPLMDFSPAATVHFLIGNVDHLGELNLADPSALWVSIGHHAGRVTTTENGGTSADLSLPIAQRLQIAREFAQSGVGMGGG